MTTSSKTALCCVMLGASTLSGTADGISVLRVETPTVKALQDAEGVLMQWGAPLPVTPFPDDTYKALIVRTCPSVSETYLSAAGDKLAKFNPSGVTSVDLGAKVGDTPEVYIPYCVGSELRPAIIRPDNVPWNIYLQQKDSPDGFTDWSAFEKQFNDLNGIQKAQPLLPGTEVYVPKAALRIPLWSDTLKQAGRDLTAKQGIGAVIDTGPKNFGVLQADPEYPDPCADDGDDSASFRASEMHFRRIADALSFNKMIDDNWRWKRNARTQIIAILDSGVEDLDSPATAGVRVKMDRAMTDADMTVDPRDAKQYHGSGVRSVALGGHLLAQINPLLGLVGDAPYRIMKYECDPQRGNEPLNCSVGATNQRLADGMRFAQKSAENISVVNISAVFRSEIMDFSSFMQAGSKYTIVVAAGNEGLSLDQASNPYPARYGGKENSNIISVASLDLAGARLQTSNHSDTYVDIGTWGCRVPVLEYDAGSGGYEIRLRTGTSYAAPQVSFVAALLANEVKSGTGGITPFEIKRRIVASSDIDGSQWADIKHGRKLNAAKALSVYTDVVETDDGRLIRGELQISTDTADFQICPNQVVNRKTLRKIARLATIPDDPQAKRYLIYNNPASSTDQALNTLDTIWCDAIHPEMTIKDVVSGKSSILDLAKVKDIVFASQPYWE